MREDLLLNIEFYKAMRLRPQSPERDAWLDSISQFIGYLMSYMGGMAGAW